MFRSLVRRLFLVAGMICMLGWTAYGDVEKDYLAALHSAETQIPVIGEFVKLYPVSLHLITYYTGQKGRPAFTSTIGIYGRYVLFVQMDIMFDPPRTKIISHSKPLFHLREVNGLRTEGRNEYVDPGDVNIDFDANKWKKIVDAHGDLTALGIPITKDKPVKEFDKHWQYGAGDKMHEGKAADK